MRVTVILENTCPSGEYGAEHGLSLWIEGAGHRLLFDSGASPLFAGNAEKLGIDLAQADMAVLSHGHYDHGGGLASFFARNSKARLYLREAAFDEHLALRQDAQEYIGLDPQLKSLDRFVFTDALHPVAPGITLFSNISMAASPNTSAGLYSRQHGQDIPDDFRHEQHLLMEEQGKTLLVTGCAHTGILNILARCQEILGRMPDAVIGGFHLAGRGPGSLLDDAALDDLARKLLATGALFYSGHCTGDIPYAGLKQTMGPKLERLFSGRLIPLFEA